MGESAKISQSIVLERKERGLAEENRLRGESIARVGSWKTKTKKKKKSHADEKRKTKESAAGGNHQNRGKRRRSRAAS